MPDADYKRCSRCEETKPRSAFSSDKSHPDGLASRCRACRSEVRRAQRKADPDQFREQERRQYWRNRDHNRQVLRDWIAANPEKKREYERRNRAKHPDAPRAHQLVYEAIQRGELIRPDECSECGTTSEAIEGHHEDYLKPLDVTWLCKPCHAELHRQKANENVSPDNRRDNSNSRALR